MKIKVILGMLLIISFQSFSQTSKADADSSQVFTIVEQMPEYPGGMKELFKFLGNNITYPQAARNKGIEGSVYVSIIVTKTGEVKDASILRGVSQDLNEEALRVIRMMPRWIPGKQGGKPVSVRYNIPVRFKLSDPVAQTTTRDGSLIFMVVEKMPEYPGGPAELSRFISKNLKQPNESELTGEVMISFVIDSTGSTRDFIVLKSLDTAHDLEALRVLRLMPKWTPGYQAGRPVTVRFNLPVKFR